MTPQRPAPQAASPLAGIQKGRQQRLLRALWYGQPGIGKTTLAANLPSPIFMSLDDGARHLNVDKLPRARTFDEVRGQIRALATEPHDYKTLVIDVIDDVEGMIRREAVNESKPWTGDKGARITDYARVPFGGADKHVIDAYWRPLLSDLERLQARTSMHLCLLAWAAEGRAGNDFGESMSMWMPRLQDSPKVSATGLLFGWAEDVLFLCFERVTSGGDDASRDSRRKDAKQVTRARRLVRTEGDGPWMAKNRHGMPAELDVSDRDSAWSILAAAMPELNLKGEAK